MWFFTVWFRSHDPYWDGVWNYIILAVETNTGFICACLPCCKPLLVRLFPSVFSNSDSRRNAEAGGGGDGVAGEGGVAGHGPSPLDPEYQRVRKKRSTWSFWGSGTGTTGTTTTSTRSHQESRRSRGAVPAGGVGTGLLSGGGLGSAADGNKSDTVILMDDLSGSHGYCRTDGEEEQDSVITHEHDPDHGLTITPQLRPTTGDTATTGNVDLELGFVRSIDHPSPQ